MIRYTTRERIQIKRIETALYLFKNNYSLLNMEKHIQNAYREVMQYILNQKCYSDYQEALISQLELYKNAVLNNFTFFKCSLQSLV